MFKKLLRLFLAGLLLSQSIAFLLAHSAEIKISGENRYKAVRLNAAIYNYANSDLSDILIKDSKGDNVPYFINTYTKSLTKQDKSYALKLINSYKMAADSYYDYRLTEIKKDRDYPATAISFTVKDKDFAREISVYGSYDNINWELIKKDKIYSIEGKEKLIIEFSQPVKFTHYRITLGNDLKQLSLSRAELIYSTATYEESYFIETLKPRFSVEFSERETIVYITGLKQLRLYDLTIHTGSTFKRVVKTPGGNKEMFNLALNETAYNDTTIELHRDISYTDSYPVIIVDEDDKPIEIESITVRYYVDELVFEGKPKEVYHLEFGEDPDKAAPVYDIERYKEEILKGEIDKVDLGNIVFPRPEAPKKMKDYSALFNVVIVLTSVLLGVVIVFKIKKAEDSSAK